MSGQPENKGLKLLMEARAILREHLKHQGIDHPLVAVKSMLARVEAEMRRLLELKPTKGRTGSNVQYVIESIDDEPMLTERRAGGMSRPFRVGREVYDATAKVLDTAKRPLLFDEIVEGVNAMLRNAPPPFHIRTCLRFWVRAPRPVLRRIKTRYEAESPGHLLAEARKLWSDLKG
jgi:hypothetical protein